MTKIVATIALPFLIIAAPALAGEPSSATAAAGNMTASSGAAAPAKAKSAAGAEKTYCLTLEAVTGTRMQQRKCRTRAEWQDLGVELSQK